METLTALPTLAAVALVGLMARMLWIAVADELNAMTKQQSAAQVVRLWNLTNPIGAKVVLDPKTAAKHTHTTSTAWVLCGEPVVSVAGECGSVGLTRVVVAEEFKEKELKHTKEPWCEGTNEDGDIVFAETQLEVVAETSREDGDQVKAFANAARIVACVNACRGINDPAAIRDALRDLQMLVKWAWEHLREGEDGFMLERIEKTLAKLKGGA